VLVNAHDGEGLVDIERLAHGSRLHLQRWTLAPGTSEGLHTHGHDAIGDEAYYVLSGQVTVTRGGQTQLLRDGQSFLFAPNESRAVRNDSPGAAVLLVCFTTEG
jgi:quercetin dioxygenase-like cupin family protein